MTIQYVTLDEAKDQLRQYSNVDDTRIEGLIWGASAAVKNYLKSGSAYEYVRDEFGDFVLDSNDEPEIELDNSLDPIVRKEVKVATLLLVDRWYDGYTEDMSSNYLPPEVQAILYPLRDPALA